MKTVLTTVLGAMLATSVLGGCATAAGADAPSARAAAPAFASERISVQTVGQGPDVILIPGLGSSPTVWTETVAAHPGHRFHLVQVQGFAGTPVRGNAEGAVVGPVAAEVARYIAEQGLERPRIIGHSMGGTIGMMVAARHPERVGRLLVVDMVPWTGMFYGPPGSTVESIRPVADQIRAGMSGPPTLEGEAMLVNIINGMVRTTDRRAGVLAESKASDRGLSARAFHELAVTDLRPELARITAPTTVLYVQPTGAPVTEAQIDAAYRAQYAGLRGVELKRVPDAAHFIMFDAPERFQSEVRSFLEVR